ncbi:hypothetical protein JW898_03675 [Candidatus Woesearchaeota archaeon]|nr:hypothetical protein [Candidatus Woesearchaeota archaeon]
MSTEALEKIVGSVQISISANGYLSSRPDVCMMMGSPDHQPFQTGYDLPATGRQLHLHGPDRNTITYGKIVDYSRNVLKELNGYDSSIASHNAEQIGLRKFP